MASSPGARSPRGGPLGNAEWRGQSDTTGRPGAVTHPLFRHDTPVGPRVATTHQQYLPQCVVFAAESVRHRSGRPRGQDDSLSGSDADTTRMRNRRRLRAWNSRSEISSDSCWRVCRPRRLRIRRRKSALSSRTTTGHRSPVNSPCCEAMAPSCPAVELLPGRSGVADRAPTVRRPDRQLASPQGALLGSNVRNKPRRQLETAQSPEL